MNEIHLTTPIQEAQLTSLKAGDVVYITGTIYTARDAAHKRFAEALAKNEPLPFDVRGQIIYYVGPTPPRPGEVIGSAGPTTAYRMDTYMPQLLALGLKGTIGKGNRSPEVRQLLCDHKAVYFAAIGGTGALLGKTIKKAEVIAYPDLGTEAVRKLEVENLPAIVVDDIYGNDLFEQGQQAYQVK